MELSLSVLSNIFTLAGFHFNLVEIFTFSLQSDGECVKKSMYMYNVAALD